MVGALSYVFTPFDRFPDRLYGGPNERFRGGALKQPIEPEEPTTATDDGYEPPALRDYGTIEAWTRGRRDISISVIIN